MLKMLKTRGMILRLSFLFVLLMVSTTIFAQTNGGIIDYLVSIVTAIFGQTTGDTVLEIIMRIVGYLTVILTAIDVIKLILPSDSPTRLFLEKVSAWIKKIIGDKKSTKKGGGYFKPEDK